MVENQSQLVTVTLGLPSPALAVASSNIGRPKGLLLSMNKTHCVEVPTFTQRATSKNLLLPRRRLLLYFGKRVPTLSLTKLRNSFLPRKGLWLHSFDDALSLDHNPHSGRLQKQNKASHLYGFCLLSALLSVASEQTLKETGIMGIMPCSPLHVIGHRPNYLYRPLDDPVAQALPDVGSSSVWGLWNPKIIYSLQPSHYWLARIVRRGIGDCFSNLKYFQKLSGQNHYPAQDSLICCSKSAPSGLHLLHITFLNLHSRITSNRLFKLKKLVGPQLLLVNKVIFIITGPDIMVSAGTRQYEASLNP